MSRTPSKAPKKPSRLTHALRETAKDMSSIGVLSEAAYKKITLRHLGEDEVSEIEPITGEVIKTLREQAHMSQAVFARHLNLTVGYVSQLERGMKRPTGAALALLNLIRRKGIDALL